LAIFATSDCTFERQSSFALNANAHRQFRAREYARQPARKLAVRAPHRKEITNAPGKYPLTPTVFSRSEQLAMNIVAP
jgi:hypothetical protein